MPEGLMWRTLANLEATSADFVIVLIGVIFAIGVWYMHKEQQRREERLRVEYNHKCDRLQSQISRLKERYHRLDALNISQSKVIQLITTGQVKLINESANGDGDYSIDRSTD